MASPSGPAAPTPRRSADRSCATVRAAAARRQARRWSRTRGRARSAAPRGSSAAASAAGIWPQAWRPSCRTAPAAQAKATETPDRPARAAPGWRCTAARIAAGGTLNSTPATVTGMRRRIERDVRCWATSATAHRTRNIRPRSRSPQARRTAAKRKPPPRLRRRSGRPITICGHARSHRPKFTVSCESRSVSHGRD